LKKGVGDIEAIARGSINYKTLVGYRWKYHKKVKI
jgi:hypothetical protein